MIVFDDIIADMPSNKNRQQIVPDLFIRGRKIGISLDFITQYYFAVPRHIKIYFALKIQSKTFLHVLFYIHIFLLEGYQ